MHLKIQRSQRMSKLPTILCIRKKIQHRSRNRLSTCCDEETPEILRIRKFPVSATNKSPVIESKHMPEGLLNPAYLATVLLNVELPDPANVLTVTTTAREISSIAIAMIKIKLKLHSIILTSFFKSYKSIQLNRFKKYSSQIYEMKCLIFLLSVFSLLWLYTVP